MGALMISFASAIDPAKLLWLIAAVGLLAIAAIGAVVLLKKKLAQNSASREYSTFTLEQLRQIYSADQISEEEYKALKERIVQENQS